MGSPFQVFRRARLGVLGLQVRDRGKALICDQFRAHHGLLRVKAQISLLAAGDVFVRDIDADQDRQHRCGAAECDIRRNQRHALDHLSSPVVDGRGEFGCSGCGPAWTRHATCGFQCEE
ncbi:hypothetical protein [Paraburkholderia youngii]|uniref:hypothetical protein n=1 Tax=Paraburkholderia youngii TaxID=2782701 RepID=UPI003D261197